MVLASSDFENAYNAAFNMYRILGPDYGLLMSFNEDECVFQVRGDA